MRCKMHTLTSVLTLFRAGGEIPPPSTLTVIYPLFLNDCWECESMKKNCLQYGVRVHRGHVHT